MACCCFRWCALALRATQLLSLIVITAIFSFLTCLINFYRLGLSMRLIVLTTLSGTVTAYLLASFYPLVRLSPLLFRLSIVADLLAIGALSAAEVLLRVSSVPGSCTGLTRQNYNPRDSDTPPSSGFDTIRFGSPGHPGELDKYCSSVKGAYYLVVLNMPFIFISLILSLFLAIHYDLRTNKNMTPETQIELSEINGPNSTAAAPIQDDPPPYSQIAPQSAEERGRGPFHDCNQQWYAS